MILQYIFYRSRSKSASASETPSAASGNDEDTTKGHDDPMHRDMNVNINAENAGSGSHNDRETGAYDEKSGPYGNQNGAVIQKPRPRENGNDGYGLTTSSQTPLLASNGHHSDYASANYCHNDERPHNKNSEKTFSSKWNVAYITIGLSALAVTILAVAVACSGPLQPPVPGSAANGNQSTCNRPPSCDGSAEGETDVDAKQVGVVLGWMSSAIYLLSRAPQLYKNFQRRSVEGLSWLMFLCAVLGNSTYAIGILLRARSWPDIAAALPWLTGSLGTLCFDFAILLQFWMFTYCETGNDADGYDSRASSPDRNVRKRSVSEPPWRAHRGGRD